MTTRDTADRQQPFNLKVAGSTTQTTGGTGKLYDIAHLQLFQGDLIRGLGGVDAPRAGRRVLAQVMHDPAPNPPQANRPRARRLQGPVDKPDVGKAVEAAVKPAVVKEALKPQARAARRLARQLKDRPLLLLRTMTRM